MKKRSLKSLKLNKKSISNFLIIGGLDSENPSNPSEEVMNILPIEGCLPASVLQNTDCTCA